MPYENPRDRADRLVEAYAQCVDTLGVILDGARRQLDLLAETAGDALAACVADGAYAQRRAAGIPEPPPELTVHDGEGKRRTRRRGKLRPVT